MKEIYIYWNYEFVYLPSNFTYLSSSKLCLVGCYMLLICWEQSRWLAN